MFHMFSDETANPHSESLIPNYVNQNLTLSVDSSDRM